jgi:hypothetical protein
MALSDFWIENARMRASLDVNAPSLNTGCSNRLQVAMVFLMPSPSMTRWASATMRSPSAAEDPNGIRSSSWYANP